MDEQQVPNEREPVRDDYGLDDILSEPWPTDQTEPEQPPEQPQEQPVWQPPQPEISQQAAQPKKKKTGLLIGLIAGAAVLLGLGGFLLDTFVIGPSTRYENAKGLLAAGQYDEAIAAFSELGDYKDSEMHIDEARYQKAKELLRNGQYDAAIEIFRSLNGYSDSKNKIKEANYKKALDRMERGDYETALELFTSLGDYSDSAEQVIQIRYLQACALQDRGDYAAASAAFAAVGDYADSMERRTACNYELAKGYLSDGDYETALIWLEALGDYADSRELYRIASYQIALNAYYAGDFAGACEGFSKYPEDEDFIAARESAVMGWLNELLEDEEEETYDFPAEFAQLTLTEREQAAVYNRMVSYCDTEDLADVEYNAEIFSGVCRLITEGYEHVNHYRIIFDVLLGEDTDNFYAAARSGVVGLWDTKFVHNIFADNYYFVTYLRGMWRTTDGVYYLEIDDDDRASYNLPWIDTDKDCYYQLDNYEFSLLERSTGTFVMRRYTFKMVAQDVIDVTCDKNGETYRLYRQS